MFESASIVDYLTKVYGPKAPGAMTDPEQVYLKADEDSTAGAKSSSTSTTRTSGKRESATSFSGPVGPKKAAASSSTYPTNTPPAAHPPDTTGLGSEKATARPGSASAPNPTSAEVPSSRCPSPSENLSVTPAAADTGSVDGKEARSTERVHAAATSRWNVADASTSRGLGGENSNPVLQSSESVLERYCEKYPEAAECRTYDS
jgi:hypothetical protein